MATTPDCVQYKDSRNLKSRGNLHARYANHSWFDWVADRLELNKKHVVVDIGCGGGWFWSSAASRLPSELQLTLVDTSDGMVAEAMQNLAGKSEFAEIAGQTANAETLPFPDQHFDCAMAMHVLYHVSAPETAIDEMARILRPGGLAAITTNCNDNMGELFDLGAQAFGGSGSDPAAAMFGVSTAKTLLARRFDTVTVHKYEDIYAIDDADDIFQYLTSFPPGIDATEPQRHGLRTLISERLSRDGGVLKVKRGSALICGR